MQTSTTKRNDEIEERKKMLLKLNKYSVTKVIKNACINGEGEEVCYGKKSAYYQCSVSEPCTSFDLKACDPTSTDLESKLSCNGYYFISNTSGGSTGKMYKCITDIEKGESNCIDVNVPGFYINSSVLEEETMKPQYIVCRTNGADVPSINCKILDPPKVIDAERTNCDKSNPLFYNNNDDIVYCVDGVKSNAIKIHNEKKEYLIPVEVLNNNNDIANQRKYYVLNTKDISYDDWVSIPEYALVSYPRELKNYSPDISTPISKDKFTKFYDNGVITIFQKNDLSWNEDWYENSWRVSEGNKIKNGVIEVVLSENAGFSLQTETLHSQYGIIEFDYKFNEENVKLHLLTWEKNNPIDFKHQRRYYYTGSDYIHVEQVIKNEDVVISSINRFAWQNFGNGKTVTLYLKNIKYHDIIIEDFDRHFVYNKPESNGYEIILDKGIINNCNGIENCESQFIEYEKDEVGNTYTSEEISS